MADSDDESSAPDKPDITPDCGECGSDLSGCMGALMLMAIGAAPLSLAAGVAGCMVASSQPHDKGGRIFVSGLLILACWLIGAIGIFFATMNSAIRDGRLAKYLPVVLCIAAPTIPTVWFYCTVRAMPWQNLH